MWMYVRFSLPDYFDSPLLLKMGNACECVSRQTDDAEDALLAPEFDGDQPPRGPPPPYQVPFLT